MSRKAETNIICARCPYFSAADSSAIYCEGVEEGSRIRLTFRTPGRLKQYKESYCFQDRLWKHCMVAQLNEEKWRRYFEDN